MIRRVVVVLVALIVGTVVVAGPVDADPRDLEHLDVSVTRAPVDPTGDVVGAATDLVVTFRDLSPEVPGIGLRAGGTIRIRLPESFVNTGSLPVASTGSAPDCAPPLVDGCSTAVILQGWPQSPILPFPAVTWEQDTNTIVVTAVADWLPNGVQAPGPKQVHLQLFGFTNPESPGTYPIDVEIAPDPQTDEILGGSARVRITRRSAPSVNANSMANGSPPPPFPNTFFQSVLSGDTSLIMAFYLWDRQAEPFVGVDFAAGSQRGRPLLDHDGKPIGTIRVRPAVGATDWTLQSGGPAQPVPAVITGIPTGRLTASLRTDPNVTGEYEIVVAVHGGNSIRHLIVAESG